MIALGERGAGWAGLPELVRRLDQGDGVLVIDDSVALHAPISAMAPKPDGPARARAVHRDPTTGLGWGGVLPGALATSAGAELLEWWEAWIDREVTDPDAGGTRWPWRSLPIGEALTLVTDATERLSAWTLDELALDEVDGLITVDGRPLAMSDLAGFHPERPWWFAPPDEEPLRFVSELPPLRTLIRTAAVELEVAPAGDATDAQLAGGIAGVTLTPELRRWFRSQLADGEAVPNPLVPGEVESFVSLLVAEGGEVAGSGESSGVSVAADLVLRARPDLRAAFPAVRWSDRDRFTRWMWTHGLREQQTSLALLPAPPVVRRRVRRPAGRPPFGVNLVGYLDRDLGLGVAARRMMSALTAAGIPVAPVSYDRTTSRRSGDASVREFDAPYAYNLLLITPDQLPYFVEDVGPGFLRDRYNIGIWYWETDVLSPRQISSFRHVDEVWAATHYLEQVFTAYDRVPVTHVPVPLEFDDPSLVDGDRERLGFDDRFTVLFSFDFLSVAERKNPLGLVEAFRRAFPRPGGERLVLKCINGDEFPDVREELLDAIADHPDIEVWDRYLSARDRLALVALADCYASLHRSEGLGLTMAEAMAMGTPVVATAYSGNLDFMDDSSALLVPAEVVEIGPGTLYPPDGHWADPDLDIAAAHLRALRNDRQLSARLADAARAHIAQFDSPSVGRVAAARLDQIGAHR